jgi:hypothetical protein
MQQLQMLGTSEHRVQLLGDADKCCAFAHLLNGASTNIRASGPQPSENFADSLFDWPTIGNFYSLAFRRSVLSHTTGVLVHCRRAVDLYQGRDYG